MRVWEISCVFVKLNKRKPRQENFLSGRMLLERLCCNALGCESWNVPQSDGACSLGFVSFENFSVLSAVTS